jgi:peptidoglycan/xylan/chitin deacetylase (PgdA/CDA1 family)
MDKRGVIKGITTKPGEQDVSLTFDDGPDPTWTPQVLQLLHQAGIHATFCLVGASAARYPNLVREIADSGDVLCDHTQHHIEHLDRYPSSIATGEIVAGAASIATAGRGAPRFYRAPGGDLSPAIISIAHGDGMAVLGWSVDPRDWKRPAADQIVAYIATTLRPGGVVLLHDGGGDRSQTVTAVAALIPLLGSRGWRFVTPAP